MASPPAESREGGLNLRKPGMKEYLIIGGLAVVLGFLYLRSKAGTASASAGASPAPAMSKASSPTGVTTENIRLWLADHNSSPKRKKHPGSGGHGGKNQPPGQGGTTGGTPGKSGGGEAED